MRGITESVIMLCFALTSLYVGSRLFPETMQTKRTEVEQWWQQQKEHIEKEQENQQLEPPNKTAQK